MSARLRRLITPLFFGLILSLLSGCLSAEQKMILKVDGFMAEQRWDDALGYLERYLGKHNESFVGWRYRVLIRLEQEERAVAAQEYHDLSEALERQAPDVLERVVLGAGGQWLLSDYGALARCAPDGIVDAAFFENILEPKELGSGSLTKVAVADDTILAVLDALPGGLDPNSTWPLVARYSSRSEPAFRERVLAAARRHVRSEVLSPELRAQASLQIPQQEIDPADRVLSLQSWKSLSLEEQRRRIAPALTAGGDEAAAIALAALDGSDAVLSQAAARALSLPGAGDESALEAALRAGLANLDPATRSATAAAIVTRGASALLPDLERLFRQGQDRVMTETLRAMIREGGEPWASLVPMALKADLPLVRELAVDAAAASCRAEDVQLLSGLLADKDPHVAVRAATALYLLIGGGA